MTDDLDIPEFLKIPQAERRATWKGRKLTKVKFDVKVTRSEDAATRAFRREVERERKEKLAARFKLLRENYPSKKKVRR
jgi:hypothetical protein